MLFPCHMLMFFLCTYTSPAIRGQKVEVEYVQTFIAVTFAIFKNTKKKLPQSKNKKCLLTSGKIAKQIQA